MTAPLLESFVAGRWYAAPDDGAPLADAVTGETVARISSTGLDVPAMLGHARTVGGPALRELTFHQRAGLLEQLALRLMAGKDELYDGVAQAVELAVRGQGSLVASIVTHDRSVAREFVLGAAHAHGRILVLDRDDAKESTGHGSPLPVLVHGRAKS